MLSFFRNITRPSPATAAAAAPPPQNTDQPSPKVLAASEPENRITDVAISAIERDVSYIQTTCFSKITLDFVKRHEGNTLKNVFFFSINYNGERAPINVEKMHQLSDQASAHLQSIYQQIEEQIDRRLQFIKEGGSTNRAFINELKELQYQKLALQNMTDFEFTKKRKTPLLKVDYVDPLLGEKKTLSISLENLGSGEQLAIHKHINMISDEYNKLLQTYLELDQHTDETEDIGEFETWMDSPLGKYFQWIRTNKEYLLDPENYHIEIDGDETVICLNMNLPNSKYYYPKVLENNQLVPHVDGEEIDLINFYGSVDQIFKEVIDKNDRYALESGFIAKQKAGNPDSAFQ